MDRHHDHAGHAHDHHAHDHRAHGHAHDHGHDHGHSHGLGGHVHQPASFGTAFAIGVALNLAFVVAEAGFGFASNSMALLADAGHNLSDVLGLVVAWVAVVLSGRRPSARFTYGLKSSSIMAALINAVLLLLALGGIGWEAVRRLFEPEPVGGLVVVAVAAAGIVVNGATAWLLAGGSQGDLNIRGAYLHMLADALVSAGVVVAGLVIMATGWSWLDPVASLVIALVILHQTWGLLTGSLAMSLQAVPPGIDLAAVRAFLRSRPGVSDLHDLHVWPIGTSDTALTCHLVIPGWRGDDSFLMETCEGLRERFGIGHATIQVETDAATACPLAPAEVI